MIEVVVIATHHYLKFPKNASMGFISNDYQDAVISKFPFMSFLRERNIFWKKIHMYTVVAVSIVFPSEEYFAEFLLNFSGENFHIERIDE